MSSHSPPRPDGAAPGGPRQNRVTPWGEIEAVPERGTLMGNRGGRIHDDDRALTRRRWASKQWIACVLAFKDRRRTVMGPGYTELFFTDDAVALAAGHRPCFECRRADAQAYAAAWAQGAGLDAPPRAPVMDAALHADRLGPRPMALAADLPPGAMFVHAGGAWLRVAVGARAWGRAGYGPVAPLPGAMVTVLTPQGSLWSLHAGWAPRLHPSAMG
ncbi:MAG: hypothetical protein ACI9ZH_000744 [Paracoccaceae bacterium]|jgi:hypothetical protein